MPARRATHFISFPISDVNVQRNAQEAISRLVNAKPALNGVHHSLAVKEKSLHLTIGIMTLDTPSVKQQDAKRSQGGVANDVDLHAGQSRLPSEADAAGILQSCEEGIQRIMAAKVRENFPGITKSGVRIAFPRLASFQSDASKCRVLYAEPDTNTPATSALREIATFVRSRFEEAGMLADAAQPLTLHCTLMKASARKNRPQRGDQSRAPSTQRRPPDDDQHASSEEEGCHIDAEGSISANGVAVSTQRPAKRRRGRFAKSIPFDAAPLLLADPPVSLGESLIERIQLCQMGRHDHTGAYLRLGEVKLCP